MYVCGKEEKKFGLTEIRTSQYSMRICSRCTGYIENDDYVSNLIMTSQEETLSNHITRLST